MPHAPIAPPVALTHEFTQWFRKANHTAETTALRIDMRAQWDERGLRRAQGVLGARTLRQMHEAGDITAKFSEPRGHRRAHFLVSDAGRFRVKPLTFEMSLLDDTRSAIQIARDDVAVAEAHMVVIEASKEAAGFAFSKVQSEIEDARATLNLLLRERERERSLARHHRSHTPIRA